MPRSPNASKLRKDFKALAAIPRSRLANVVEDFAVGLLSRIKSRAPRETGELAGSIELALVIEDGGERIRVVITVDSDHALAVEYGTASMAPRPFFRVETIPANAKLLEAVRAGLDEGIRRSNFG